MLLFARKKFTLFDNGGGGTAIAVLKRNATTSFDTVIDVTIFLQPAGRITRAVRANW